MKNSILLKQKLRKQHYLVTDLIIIMYLKVCIRRNSLLCKTSLKIKNWSFRNLGNSVVIVDRQLRLYNEHEWYPKWSEKILRGQNKVSLKDVNLLNVDISQKNTLVRFSKNLLSLIVWQKNLKKSLINFKTFDN